MGPCGRVPNELSTTYELTIFVPFGPKNSFQQPRVVSAQIYSISPIAPVSSAKYV